MLFTCNQLGEPYQPHAAEVGVSDAARCMPRVRRLLFKIGAACRIQKLPESWRTCQSGRTRRTLPMSLCTSYGANGTEHATSAGSFWVSHSNRRQSPGRAALYTQVTKARSPTPGMEAWWPCSVCVALANPHSSAMQRNLALQHSRCCFGLTGHSKGTCPLKGTNAQRSKGWSRRSILQLASNRAAAYSYCRPEL